MNTAEFVKAQGIRARAERATSNPYMEPAMDGARHWTVTLEAGGRKILVPFTQGSAHTQEPTAEDVLDCLASDAASVENARGFEDWAVELGFDSDSRAAERSYKATLALTAKLRKLLTPAQYDVLLWHTERR